MNKHLKCLLIFVGIIVAAFSISLGVITLLDWLAEVFSEQTVMIGSGVFIFIIVAIATHIMCDIS